MQSVSIPSEFVPQHTDRFIEDGIRYVDADHASLRHGEQARTESPGVQCVDINAGVEGDVKHYRRCSLRQSWTICADCSSVNPANRPRSRP
jgi:hypothetical protein